MKKNVKHFIFLTASALAGLHIVNRMLNRTACMKNLLNYNIGEYYDWKHGKIYYTKSGSGSPILLIHDLHPASSSYEWHKMMKKLEKRHTVYTIDLLGCGRSDKPALTYTNYLYVQLITNFIQDMIGEKTDIVATGDSSSFAVMAANMEPDLFGKVILINPQKIEDSAKAPRKNRNILKLIMETPIIGTFIYNMSMNELRIHRLFAEKYFNKKQLISTKLEDTYFESAHIGEGTGRFLFASIATNYTNIDIATALKNKNLSLCIISSRERPNCVSIIDNYLDFNHDIETTYISHSKYLPQLETPDKLNEALKIFL